MRKVKHRTFLASLMVGWASPQAHIQITPFSWGLEAMYQSTEGRPVKIGFKIGCVAVSWFVGKTGFRTIRHFDNSTHVTFHKDD